MTPTFHLYFWGYAATVALLFALLTALLSVLFITNLQVWADFDFYFFVFGLSFGLGFKIIRDVWVFCPYAYHSQKFIVSARELPFFEGEATAALIRLPAIVGGLMGGLLLAAVLSLCMGAMLHYWPDFTRGAFGALLPCAMFILIFTFCITARSWFLKPYIVCGQVKSRTMTARQYLFWYYALPDALSIFVVTGSILFPLRHAQDFAPVTGALSLAQLGMVAMVFSISVAAVLSGVKSGLQQVMAGTLFSRLITLTQLESLSGARREESATASKWMIVSGMGLVLALEVLLAVLQLSGLAWRFEVFLGIALLMLAGIYFYFRWHALCEALGAAYRFYRDDPFYYKQGQLTPSDELPVEFRKNRLKAEGV